MKHKQVTKILIMLFSFLVSSDLFAADDSLQSVKLFNLIFLLILILTLFAAVMFGTTDEKGTAALLKEKKEGILKKVLKKLTGSAPLAQENDIMLEHEYDGIKELNNSVPPWLNYIFIGTLIFSIIYVFHYHVFGTGKSQIEEYAEEMEIARMDLERLMQSGAFITENNVTTLTDDASLKTGKEKFLKDCSPCHGMNAEGTIGPNLTDDHWIHGGKISDLFRTVKNGVPEKGMVAWGQQLNPKQIQEVVSYIISIHGTSPPNGKAPEGELFIPGVKADTIKTDSAKVKD